MIDVKFTKKHSPNEAAVICTSNRENHNFAKELSKKPKANVVEVFLEENRLLIARIDFDSRQMREEAGKQLFLKALEGTEKELIFDCAEEDVLTGLLLASFSFDSYFSEKPHAIEQIVVLYPHLEKHYLKIKPIIEGIFYAKALTSEPPNVLFPAAYAEKLLELKNLGIDVEILDEKKLATLEMQGVLAVGNGSERPPRVVVLHWRGSEEAPIAVVGKGVCFDSGGLCLKPWEQQLVMKWDKAGAGVVAGFLKALALAKIPRHVIGIIGLAENMPDGAAMRPGDIIKTASGQTVEIVHTDAEGRLILADCLWYANTRFQPATLIDLGTLTLETFASLGDSYAGLYANNHALAASLKKAGENSFDHLWELPMGDYFAKQIISSVADMKNLGVEYFGENGAAAEFLKKFVGNTPWAHIDIAGVSWSGENSCFGKKGVTGFGVRLLCEWLFG